jgi:hypothetical protein
MERVEHFLNDIRLFMLKLYDRIFFQIDEIFISSAL